MILFQTFWVQPKSSRHISHLYEFETWGRNQLSISVSSRQTSHDCAGKCYVFFKRRRGFHRVFNSVSCSLTFFTCVAKYLKDKKRNSVSFARKYVRIFVLGYYLFLEAHSFRILEQKIRENDCGKYSHLFWRQIGAIVYIALYGDLKFSRGKHSAI